MIIITHQLTQNTCDTVTECDCDSDRLTAQAKEKQKRNIIIRQAQTALK